jgi:hypothetical protein
VKVGDLVRKRNGPTAPPRFDGMTGIVIETHEGGSVIKVAWSHDYGSFCYPSETKALEKINESR